MRGFGKTETMMIDGKNGPVIINKSDFDEKSMKEHKPTKKEQAAIDPPAPVAPDASNPPAPSAIDNGNPAIPDNPSATQMLVTKKGKKFIVVDGEGNAVEHEKIDASGYDDEVQAWAAVGAVNEARGGGNPAKA